MNLLDKVTLKLSKGKYTFFSQGNGRSASDGAGLTGRLKMKIVRGPSGGFGPPGEEWESPWIYNIVTKTGVAIAAALVGGVGAETAFTLLEIGHSDTAAANTDTKLTDYIADTNNCGRAAATVTRVTTDETNDTLQLVHTWTCDTATESDIQECGVFSAATVDTTPMLGRQVTATANLAVDDTLTITYQFKFAGSTW